MSWDSVATRLLQAAFDTPKKKPVPTTSVAVLDMQPITPAVGGGRQRLLGLYHNLGEDIDCHYVGSYDWPGESYRRNQLTSGLEEITVPLSDEHHTASQLMSSQANGKTVIDIAFSQLGHLSKNYLETAQVVVQNADVVIFSHPWVYPLLATYLRAEQIIVYDSQNVEGYLRAQLLDESNSIEKNLLRQVVQDEYELSCRADLVLVCSKEDMTRFNRVYDIPFNKMRVAPNGVMAFTQAVPDGEAKKEARKSLKLEPKGLIAIFIGSPYGPNLDAAQFIAEQLAVALPAVTFIIAGGVGGHLAIKRSNVIITGEIDEQEKYQWFCAADIAVNPMFSGSGTNIKMFDFMALKLPTVTTAIGARGIEMGARQAMLICEPDVKSFVSAINQLQDAPLRNSIGNEARVCVEEGYAWERISPQIGATLKQRHQFSGQTKPLFSVVIPTYERHDQLENLVKCLQNQIERDFEIVIVDQSVNCWCGAEQEYGFPVLYYHSPVKGAVRARNTGAALAQGEIIAFTDDDCLPDEAWLINARRYFNTQSTVGIEGIIVSDHLGESDWRQVTNVGFEGVGFMTANLMVRSSVFQQLGGFDLQFDKPHFREDTDFGWRMLEVGDVPYAKNVSVFHPAQPRANERESAVERVRFFEKDALLFKKHPERYQELFLTERHYVSTQGFNQTLMEGFDRSNIPLPEWMKPFLKK
ncbi:MAG: glycosyltransferase [Methyloprofundus sp.]|nr:glycosyltransferase [Methyloprofundus sp.]